MTAHSHVRLQFRCLGNRRALTLKPRQKQTYLFRARSFIAKQGVLLVIVKCVLKTTDRAPPLSVNNFYGTKHHCARMIFSACYPVAKMYQTKSSNWTSKRVALPIMSIEPTFIHLETNATLAKRVPYTANHRGCLQSARNRYSVSSSVSILTRKEIMKKSCNRLRLRAGVVVD